MADVTPNRSRLDLHLTPEPDPAPPVPDPPAQADPPTVTPLARLLREALAAQRLSYGDVEARGGPTRQTLSNLINRWNGTRSPDEKTVASLSFALGIPERTLREAIGESMGYARPPEQQRDGLTLLVDALRTEATDVERQVVVEAATAVWQVLRAHRPGNADRRGWTRAQHRAAETAAADADRELAEAAREGMRSVPENGQKGTDHGLGQGATPP